jgi:uncharacterized protein
MTIDNPCIRCGACCAAFRVSFHWMESSLDPHGCVPDSLIEPVDHHRVAMAGTLYPPLRCNALNGTIGDEVLCAIYPQRPSPCRDFHVAWLDGQANPRCDQARLMWGLPPLVPPRTPPQHPDLPNLPQAA